MLENNFNKNSLPKLNFGTTYTNHSKTFFNTVSLVIISYSSYLFLFIHIFQALIEERTKNFKFGKFDSSNRPPPLLVKHLQNGHIVGTAAQKLCLFKLFPIIFNDIIDHLPSFIVYKILREILDLILSYPFRRKWLPVLGELCNTFHQTMLIHFPDKIVPKTHFVREYQHIITDFGPPIRYWSFRYESFHAYFKKITIRNNNFKNVAKSLASRYRLK